MSPKFHAVQGAVGAAVLYPFMGTDALIFGLAVFLIDLDHIIPFVRDCKSLSLRRFFEYYRTTSEIPNFLGLSVFHTLEFFLLLFVLGYWHVVFWIILAACLFHMIFDVVKCLQVGMPFLRAYSLVEYAVRSRNKTTRHYVD